LERLRIEGGQPLAGSIQVHGAKNAALPIIAATTLVAGVHEISNVPQLKDIEVMLQILQALGCKVSHINDVVTINTSTIHSTQIPELLMRQMRSSIFLLGPLLARFGEVETFQPGGCAIGERKVDLHFSGLEALGAEIIELPASIRCVTRQLKGASIRLHFPSVGATENMMMAAVLANGTTCIHNAAKEPEIIDLQHFLNALGAQVSGAGTETIVIEGVPELHATNYRVIPDRIVAGTLLCAAVATKGDIVLRDVRVEHLTSVTNALSQMGARFEYSTDMIRIMMARRPKSMESITTGPYPAFPTDLQAQIMVLLSLSEGFSMLNETIFERRFQHVEQLQLLGSNIRTEDGVAYIQGVRRLQGGTVAATDLRAGAALIIAGLAAQGTTWIEQLKHIDRGYDRVENMFAQLGATITRDRQDRVIEQIVI
jgi:UDP-N-acetylglucosamine 1-carboxyvinyltransferase